MSLADLERLAELSLPGPGVSRRAWSEQARAAARWFERRCGALELDFVEDEAGNLFGTWSAGEGKPLLLGSHLDSVPNGGRFDGALGVVGAFDALEQLKQRGVNPATPVTVVAFNDEEGGYQIPMFGSQCFAGRLDLETWRTLGIPEAMDRYGKDFNALPEAARVEDFAAYLELHIEQGPVLDRAGEDLGVVTSIVGALVLGVRLTGQANHSGTTPFELRRDALAAASRLILDVRDAARQVPGVSVTVGKLNVSPGAQNVIPGEVNLVVDLRWADAESSAFAVSAVREAMADAAAAENVALDVGTLHRHESAGCDAKVMAAIERAAEGMGVRFRRMPSGAGHDALSLGDHLPFGMLFVPSRDGISHSPDEHSDGPKCQLGIDVLAGTVEALVAGPAGASIAPR